MAHLSDYTVLVCNSVTDTIIGEVDPVTIQYSEELNRAGAATITIPLDTAATKLPTLAPLAQSVYLLRDDVPVWAGIVWGYNMNVANNTVALNCAGFLSLLDRRRIRDTTKFVAEDQALIVKSLVDTASAQSGGGLLIDTSAINAVGKLRDRTYYGYTRKNVGEAIHQMSNVRDGFDYAIRPVYTAGGLTRRMTLSYPNTGRHTDIVLDGGSNVDVTTVTCDATAMTTVQHVRGEGDGEDAITVTATNATLLGSYPLVESLYVASGVTRTTTADEYAQRGLDMGGLPVVIPTVLMSGDSEPRIGSYTTGDRVRVRATHGLLNLDDTFRIIAWSVVINNTGSEQARLTLAPLEVFSDA